MFKVRSIDTKIVELYDKGTTFLQKRGIIPLNTLIMGTNVLFWGITINHTIHESGTFWLSVIIIIGAVILSANYYWWHQAQGYWEDHRKMMKLNGSVLVARENWPVRLFIIGASCLFLCFDLFDLDLTHIIAWVLVVTINYLMCCTYIGPGDYAKDRQSKLLSLPQES